jgi:hypothetical protein
MIDTEKYQPAGQNMKFAHSPPNFIFWLGRLIFSVSLFCVLFPMRGMCGSMS